MIGSISNVSKLILIAISVFALSCKKELPPKDPEFTYHSISLSSGSATCFHFINNAEGFVGTSDGKIKHTTDSGTTWSSFYLPWYISASIQDIHFMSATKGFIVSDFLHTYKNSTWDINQLNSDQGTLNTIKFIDDSHGILYGTSSDQLYITSDGGDSWIKIKSPFSDITEISFDKEFVVMLGEDGYLASSKDYGASWKVSAASGLNSISGVDVVNKNFIIATSYNTVYSTNSNLSSFYTEQRDIYLGTPRFCNLDDNTIFETHVQYGNMEINYSKNGGKYWQSITIQNGNYISEFQKVENEIYALSQYGILRGKR